MVVELAFFAPEHLRALERRVFVPHVGPLFHERNRMMFTRIIWAIAFGVLSVPLSGVAQERPIAEKADATSPLEKGQKIPEAKLMGIDDQPVTLSSLHETKPLVIIFFRGSWCPICTRHTKELIKAYPQIQEKGYQMVGISPDSVENSKTNIDENSIPFPIYSDSGLQAIRGFGLAFRVDDTTLNKYKGFGIDLEKASGRNHHALPIPAIYVVNTEGVVTFAYSNPDYRQRLDAKELLDAISQ